MTSWHVSWAGVIAIPGHGLAVDREGQPAFQARPLASRGGQSVGRARDRAEDDSRPRLAYPGRVDEVVPLHAARRAHGQATGLRHSHLAPEADRRKPPGPPVDGAVPPRLSSAPRSPRHTWHRGSAGPLGSAPGGSGPGRPRRRRSSGRRGSGDAGRRPGAASPRIRSPWRRSPTSGRARGAARPARSSRTRSPTGAARYRGARSAPPEPPPS